MDGILHSVAQFQGVWRQGETTGSGDAEDEEEGLDDGVTHVVNLRRRDDVDDDPVDNNNSYRSSNSGICPTSMTSNQRPSSSSSSSKTSTHSFIVDCLTRRSTLTPHLLRALAISVPPLIVYVIKKPKKGFSQIQEIVLNDIRTKITQIVEAASLKSPLPLLKASVLICMMEEDDDDDVAPEDQG